MDHHRAANDGGLAIQLDESIQNFALCNTCSIGLNVAKVADVTLIILRTAMGLAKWVVMGSRRSAAIAEIRFLVNMEPMKPGGQARDLVGDLAHVAYHFHSNFPADRATSSSIAAFSLRPNHTDCLQS